MSNNLKASDGKWLTEIDENVENRSFITAVTTPNAEELDKWTEVSDEWKTNWENEHSEDVSMEDNIDIEELRNEKLDEIKAYDKSDSVNSFTYNGISGWIDNPTRTSYSASIQNAELLGETSIDLLFNDTVLTLDIDTAKVMLAKISRYADKCWMVTQTHISKVKDLKTSKEIRDFDVTSDYPEKLEF